MKRYALKPGTTIASILDYVKAQGKYHIYPGGSWVKKDAEYIITIYLYDDISLNLTFPLDLTKWDDFDYIEVLDEECVQPYTPFYKAMDGTLTEPFEFLDHVIEEYDKTMDSFPFLEEKAS